MKFWRLFTLALPLAAQVHTAFAASKLVVLSPHRKTIQNEFIPLFEAYYKEKYKEDIKVDWVDQGGTNEGVKFLRAKFGSNPATSGVDVFWGGGTTPFLELAKDKFLTSFDLPADLQKQLPQDAAGVPMYDATKSWYASAMSSFGIFYNKRLLKIEKLPEPKGWSDLADPKYLNKISLADPRASGTANQMNTIVLQGLGWDEGWKLLTAIAGNTRQFTHSSSDPIKAVVTGDAALTMAIDFYAFPKIAELGTGNLGFILPEGQTILDPDPIAILKGSPNRTAAERFVAFILSPEAQNLLMLPKGAPGGPKHETLGRLAVNVESYKLTEGKRVLPMNPFTVKPFMKLDTVKAAKMRQAFDDLTGAIMIDTHKELKEAWARIVKNGTKADEIADFAKPPVTEAELLKLSEKWSNNVFRNETINRWVEYARQKYARLGVTRAG